MQRAPLFLAILLASSPASAAAPAPKPVVPAAAPPRVKLTVDGVSPGARWRVRVENVGDVPVRLVADARLLSFEVTAVGAKAPVTCMLPADMRPSSDLDHGVVLPPKRAWSETINPRLYCFGPANTAALASGSVVMAKLGWAPPRTGPATRPPLVVAPIEGMQPVVAGAKEITSDKWTLGPDTTITTAPQPVEAIDAFAPRLTVTSPERIEASRTFELSVPVTVTNEGTRPVTLMLRPDSIGFDITNPAGTTVRCGAPGGNAAVREAFTTLPAKGRRTVSVLLSSLCPGNAFEQSGLYAVRARIDTRRMSGDAIGLRTFDGEVNAAKPTTLRLRHTRGLPLRSRPTLE